MHLPKYYLRTLQLKTMNENIVGNGLMPLYPINCFMNEQKKANGRLKYERGIIVRIPAAHTYIGLLNIATEAEHGNFNR